MCHHGLGAERRGPSSRLGPDRRGGVCHHGLGRTGVAWRGKARLVIMAWIGKAGAWHGTTWLVITAWDEGDRIGPGCHCGLDWAGPGSARRAIMAWGRAGEAQLVIKAWLGLGQVGSSLWLGLARQDSSRTSSWLGAAGQGSGCHHGLVRQGLARRARAGYEMSSRLGLARSGAEGAAGFVIMAWAGGGGARAGLSSWHGMAWAGSARHHGLVW